MPFQESKKPKWEGANRLYSMDEAAAEAEKWLFDYSNPLPSVKYLRKSAFGAPFLSYPSFVAPLLIETILTRPWKFIPHILFGEAMIMGFKSVYDISDEEFDALFELVDFDGSGDVGFSDFLAFVAQFGKTSSDGRIKLCISRPMYGSSP